MPQTILITGASSGIGKVTANFFAERGRNVVLITPRPEKEEEPTRIESTFAPRLAVTATFIGGTKAQFGLQQLEEGQSCTKRH
ncbi:hypothetical protein NBRC116594_09060 [Shimia sp. NS0008-38b]|uniref:SDR family NAD(P)-dependent oxidoreductase n=1 Tax=Shimia sp. NS0008-38b TaxID=3127653 RepID=UPI003106BEAC